MQEFQQAERPKSILLAPDLVNSYSSPDKRTFSQSYHWMAYLLTSVFSSSVIAVESLDDLLSLSLLQLSQIQIEVASKRLEGINDAPSVVTVMTAEEIAMFGGKDLYEVLGRFVGVQTSWRAEGIGRAQVGIRNDQPSGSDYRHTLILLNGSPFNVDSYNGNIWNQAALAALPLDAIARIELIRGPGSVLHGTTAFQGVINIVTKEDVDEDGFQNPVITVARGSRDTESYRAQLQYGNGDFALSAYAMGLNSAGERLQGFSSNLLTPYFNESMHEDSFGLLAEIRYRELKATFWYGSNDQGTARRNPIGGRMDESEIFNQRYFANVSYPIHLSDIWDLEVRAVTSGFRNDLELVDEGPRILYESDEQSLELNLSGALSQQTRLLTGMVATHYSGETPGAIQPIPEGWDYLWWSVYSQIDYRPRENIKFTLGGQYNKAEKNTRFVPRLGVVIDFNESWGMKLLYGEAFRSPVAAEVMVAIPALNIFGNPDLKPELVATTDLQLFYQRDNAQAAITVFHSKHRKTSACAWLCRSQEIRDCRLPPSRTRDP